MPIQILNLVLHSNTPIYNEMYTITNEHYKKYTNVKTVYYLFSDIEKEYEYDSETNILQIKGIETFIPGQHKTIKAFEFFRDEFRNYDYVVRPNASSIVNFDNLCNELNELTNNNNPMNYGGLWMHIADGSTSPDYGIIDNRFANLNYASGTCIILSKNAFAVLMDGLHLYDDSAVDDVSIGDFIHKHTEYTFTNLTKVVFTTEDHFLKNMHNNTNDKLKEYILFRNRSNDRYYDIEIMKYIAKNI